jgi:hypothetical protein
VPGETPVRGQLVAVKVVPLADKSGCCPREISSDDRPVIYPVQAFVLAVDRMEVGRVVVAEVHVDRDSVELAQPRHAADAKAQV